MRMRRLIGTRAAGALLFLLVWGASVWAGVAVAAASPAPVTFQRPDAGTIRQTMHSILSDPRYAPRKTFFQWLGESLSHWRIPHSGLLGGLGAVLRTILLVWCLLALLAILVYTIWTFVSAAMAGRVLAGPGGRMGLSGPRAPASYDDLLARMQALAQRGAFREATGLMMMALLRWLEGAGALRYRPGKTNGEYVRDYAAARAGSGQFRRFVLAFDALAYGGAACGPRVYERMFDLFKEIQRDVRQKPQV